MKLLGIHIGYKNQHKILFTLILILLLALIYLTFIKRGGSTKTKEGFSQDVPYLAKHDQEIFDDFLAEVYDRIHQPRGPNRYIFDTVEKLTQPSKEYSVILDAGCGTGELLGYMTQRGYKYSYGMDQSQDMISICQQKWPMANSKIGDILVPMTFDKATFSHVFITGDTIYYFPDYTKLTVLRNLYSWLMPNGYLILQLYDPLAWNPIPLAGRPLLVNSVQDYTNQRVTNSQIDFIGFLYKSIFDFSKWEDTKNVIHQESFVDADSNSVRQNEITLYMNPIEEIIQMCQYVGFLVHGQIDMKESILKDPNQYVFILQKPT